MIKNSDAIGNWIFNNQQSDLSEKEMEQQITLFTKKPLISIIMPLYNAPVKCLRQAIDSIQRQVYQKWELCAVDDGSIDLRGLALLEQYANNDERIHIVCKESNDGISVTSNVALEMAEGEFIALMDQDDEMSEDALFWIVKRINEVDGVDWLYTDECKIDADSSAVKSDFFFKPDWSPFLLMNKMYTGHLSVYRKSLVDRLGGFRKEFDFSQDYDLALRMSEITKNIEHIERILYFWRMLPTSGSAGGKDFARETNLKALGDWYKRQGIEGYPRKNGLANAFAIRRNSEPLVSIIIPSDSYDNLILSIGKILSVSSYHNIEIIPVTNSLVAKKIEDYFNYCEGVVCSCRFDKLYNFSEKCNEGAKKSRGEFIIFYNDDVIPYSIDWIERLLDVMVLDEVGGVSPLLFHENLTVQYAGMITGVPGLIGTAFNGRKVGELDSYNIHHLLLRDVSVLSGACMMMKKEYFFNVGMFDHVNTPNGHSDVDISFKIMEDGRRCVYTPYSSLMHIGNHSWNEMETQDKADIYCLKRWNKYVTGDPFFTNSMKKLFYQDIPYNYEMYSPEVLVNKNAQKDVLIISHEFTVTGAPLVLIDFVDILIKDGYFPVVLSYKDGPLKRKYLERGVTVIVAEDTYFRSKTFRRFAHNFDLVIANTMSCVSAVNNLQNIYPNVLWWLHEGTDACNSLKNKVVVPLCLSENIHLYCVGGYSRKICSSYVNKDITILNYGVKREDLTFKESKHRAFRFALIGAIEKRKGQDILADAIQKLSQEVINECKFIFVGIVRDGCIYEKLKKLEASGKYNVKVTGFIEHDEMAKLYHEIDCVVVPSRDDPLPVVATEGMMWGVPCVCSDTTGIADYITNGENGYIFESENTDQLVEIVEKIVMQGKDKIRKVGEEGRKIYNKEFQFEIFEENVQKVVEKLIR